jgi:ATP-dependent DNA helicase 2 subunit 1
MVSTCTACAEIHAQTNYIGAAGDYVQPEVMTRKFVDYGGQKVVLSAPDIAEAKRSCGVEGIHILGFRPAGDIARWLQLSRVARFMYPEEESAQKGATAAFTALAEAMADRDRVAIAAYARTDDRNAGVRCCALITSKVTVPGAAAAVNGLHVVNLPFLDDVRHPERAHAVRGWEDEEGADVVPGARGATEEQIAAAAATVDSMMVHEYTPLDIPNPTLSRHYRALELQALDKEWCPEADGIGGDMTQPPSAATLEGVGAKAAVEAFKLAVYGANHDAEVAEEEGGGGTKRKAAVSSGMGVTLADIDFKAMAAAGELESLTGAKLKEYCAANGLPKTGVKAVLASRVTEFLMG